MLHFLSELFIRRRFGQEDATFSVDFLYASRFGKGLDWEVFLRESLDCACRWTS